MRPRISVRRPDKRNLTMFSPPNPRSIIGLVSPMMLENLAHGGTYFFFAGFAVLAFLSTYFFLPETRLKTLEEMDELFNAKSTSHERDITSAVRQELGLERSDSVEAEKAV